MIEGGGMMELKQYEIAANGISLHVTEVGAGPVVLFCHGFPDTSYTWRQQMTAVASAGFRAIGASLCKSLEDSETAPGTEVRNRSDSSANNRVESCVPFLSPKTEIRHTCRTRCRC